MHACWPRTTRFSSRFHELDCVPIFCRAPRALFSTLRTSQHEFAMETSDCNMKSASTSMSFRHKLDRESAEPQQVHASQSVGLRNCRTPASHNGVLHKLSQHGSIRLDKPNSTNAGSGSFRMSTAFTVAFHARLYTLITRWKHILAVSPTLVCAWCWISLQVSISFLMLSRTFVMDGCKQLLSYSGSAIPGESIDSGVRDICS